MNKAFLTDIHFNDREVLYLKNKRKELLTQFISKHGDNVNHVIFGGDIFDTVNVDTSSEVAKFFFNDVIGTLLKKGIRVDIVVGNHEKLWKKNVYSLLWSELINPLLTIHNELNYRIGEKCNEIFLPYVYPSDFNVSTIEESEKEVKRKIEAFIKEIRSDNNNPIILYNHNCMWGAWFEVKNEINLDLTKIKWLDLILWGHIHKHIELSDNAMYVGALMRSFHYEEESEGYYLFGVDDKWSINWEYVENKSFDYEKIELYDDQDYQFQEGVLYTINFKIKNPKDKFYIANTIRKCQLNGWHVKSYKHEQISEKRKLQWTEVNIMQTNEEILRFFMKESKIKNEELKDYLIKLSFCSSGVKYKNIADAKAATNIEEIENRKIRKSRTVLNKFEKKQKESIKVLKDQISLNDDFTL